jgi:hypothetical protein
MRLTTPERKLATLVFDAILPSRPSSPGDPAAKVPLSASEAGVVDFFEEHLTFLPSRTGWALRAAVLLLGGYAASVGRLHPRRVTGALEALASSRVYMLREAMVLVKSVVAMGYYANPDVRERIGLDARLSDVVASTGAVS